jgi:ADP-ribose pyrophosphatase YjhB (NUDIX family)
MGFCMVQAYGFITDGVNCLIPKKAIDNDLWGGTRSASRVLVNQAGQYALFGGRVEAKDTSAESAVKREMFEESGVRLGDEAKYHEIASTPYYRCYAVVVTTEQLAQIQKDMSSNISVGKVKDGEMQSVEMMPLDQVGQKLGVDQKPVLDAQQSRQKALRPERHSIDWYGQIAQEVQTKLQVIREAAVVERRSSSQASSGSEVSTIAAERDRRSDRTEAHVIDEDDVRSETPESLRVGLEEHYKSIIPEFKGDTQTRDNVAKAMTDVIMQELSKDPQAMDIALNDPSKLYKVCSDFKDSMKVDRFLEENYHSKADIQALFKEEKYRVPIANSGWFGSKYSTENTFNISQYVASVVQSGLLDKAPVESLSSSVVEDKRIIDVVDSLVSSSASPHQYRDKHDAEEKKLATSALLSVAASSSVSGVAKYMPPGTRTTDAAGVVSAVPRTGTYIPPGKKGVVRG